MYQKIRQSFAQQGLMQTLNAELTATMIAILK